MKGIQGTSNETYRKLMGNGLRFEIPKFQRDYSWETENWDDLWNDILYLMSNEEVDHYMGYLVLQTSNSKIYTIIDGQQRLTTLSILILSSLKLFTKFIDNGEDVEDNLRRIDSYRNSYIGTLDNVTLISDNKLKLNRNSDDYYRLNMVLLKELPVRNTNTSEKQMRECFLWMYNKLTKVYNNGKDLALFLEKIVDGIYFTVITVSDQLNAFKVFETLNARGLQLSASDLLKNYLFSILDQDNSNTSEIDELEYLWGKIVGKLGSYNFEDYLRYVWNSRHKTIRKNQLYKVIRNNIKTKEETFALLRDLLDSADIFISIQDPNSEFWLGNHEVKTYLYELKLFQIKQTNSLLLSGYKNLPTNLFNKLVKTVAIISLRYNVIGGLNPNEQEEVYNKLANDIHLHRVLNLQELLPIYIQDASFENDFSTKQFRNSTRNHKILKYLLSKIELYLYNNEISIDSDNYTIEHILPESADLSWGNFNDEELARSIYRIGNLTLLERRLNQNADKLEFSKKLEIYKTSNCELTKSIVTDYNNWDENKITSRQKELAKHAKGIWRVQELSI